MSDTLRRPFLLLEGPEGAYVRWTEWIGIAMQNRRDEAIGDAVGWI